MDGNVALGVRVRMALLDEVIDACDIEQDLARNALRRALRESGCDALSPSAADLRTALPALRRALEEILAPNLAYDAVERVDILLAVKPPDMPSEPPSLEELTKRLREANQRMSTRDYAGEAAEAEANMVVRKRRSMFPSSR